MLLNSASRWHSFASPPLAMPFNRGGKQTAAKAHTHTHSHSIMPPFPTSPTPPPGKTRCETPLPRKPLHRLYRSLASPCARLLSRFNHVRLFATPWTVACQAPLSMGFSRQEHWSGLPCPPPGNLPNPGIEPSSLMSPALVGRFFTTSATWEAPAPVHRTATQPWTSPPSKEAPGVGH